MGSYLHRIKNDKQNVAQDDLIREFSIQLLHEPIFISANGFFHIDFNLLGSVCIFHENFNDIKLNYSFQ